MRLELHNLVIRMTIVLIAMASPAFAGSGGGLPWEAPLERVQESITGPVATPAVSADHDISGDLQHLSGVMLFHEVDP